MTPVLVIGGRGMLGRELCRALQKAGHTADVPPRENLDLTDTASIQRTLEADYSCVINTAALIHVDTAEAEPALASAVNAEGPGEVVRALAGRAVPYVHISTNYVFGGARPYYTESDMPDPINEYGRSKAEGERIVQEEAGAAHVPHYIIRTSWIYSTYRKTYIDDVIAHLERGEPYIALDHRGNPTYAKHLAEDIVDRFVQPSLSPGIYHRTNGTENKEGVSRYEIAQEAARLAGFSPDLVQLGDELAVFKTARPTRTALTSTKLPPLAPWRSALEEYIRART